jgi:hypothetical protein
MEKTYREKRMAVFIVEPETAPDAESLPQAEKRPFLKEKLTGMLRLIDNFNRQAGAGGVTVLESAWINTTARIEASPEAAQALAQATGLNVSSPRPLSRD